MKIKTIQTQIRNDIYGTLECESCGFEQKFVGYDDANYRNNVIPRVKCQSCGKATQEAA